MVRCVRVPRSEGEAVRAGLLDSGILDTGHRIRADGADLLIPMLSDSFGGYPAEDVELAGQEHAETDYRNLLDIPPELRDGLPNSYDVIGDVAILKLADALLPYRSEIGGALMKVTPNIRVVMLDSGVKGEYRIRDLEKICGSGTSETVHREFGVRMFTDPSRVYFNPRLATERARVAADVGDGEVVIDMFAGVAPFGMVICKQSSPKVVYSIDLNPDAEAFMRRNMDANRVRNMVPITGDAGEVVSGLPEADRIIMNLPQMSDAFLRYALAKVRVGGKIHMYRILERSEVGGFASGMTADMRELGLNMRIDRASELKTYSPTMSVYSFDIVRDP